MEPRCIWLMFTALTRGVFLISEAAYVGSPDSPEGPSIQKERTLVPGAVPLMVFGTRDLKYWIFGPSG